MLRVAEKHQVIKSHIIIVVYEGANISCYDVLHILVFFEFAAYVFKKRMWSAMKEV